MQFVCKSRDKKFFVSLESTELSSESLSSNSTVQNSFEDQPKKLPSQNFPLSSNSRTQSLNDLSESTDLSRLKSCPPSFKNSTENLKNATYILYSSWAGSGAGSGPPRRCLPPSSSPDRTVRTATTGQISFLGVMLPLNLCLSTTLFSFLFFCWFNRVLDPGKNITDPDPNPA